MAAGDGGDCGRCGDAAATTRCDDCGLSYCGDCAALRHAQGAFQRHRLEDLTTAVAEAATATSTAATTRTPPPPPPDCDECHRAGTARVRCVACELRYCPRCLVLVHRRGSMQAHEGHGDFVSLGRRMDDDDDDDGDDEEEEDEDNATTRRATSSSPHRLELQDADDDGDPSHGIGPKDAVEGGVCGDEHDEDAADPDQEKSPMPLVKGPHHGTSAPASASTPTEAFDLWGGPWGVRAGASSRTPNASSDDLDDLDDDDERRKDERWRRGFRALSMDASGGAPLPPPPRRQSPPAALALADESITRSLRSLSFASTTDELEMPSAPQPPPTASVATRQLFGQRPRSFSDYTSLGSSRTSDIWRERVEEAVLPLPLSTTTAPGTVEELYRSFKTSFASRHVVVKSHLGGLDVHRLCETLATYGAVASIRDDFAPDGLVFCTYFELKAAIGAVKLSATSLSAKLHGETIRFSLPYEIPTDANCATVLVTVAGQPCVSSNEMHQLCSHYGEVASVLQNDPHTCKYIVEFNDSRHVARAMTGLSGITHLPAVLSVVRSHPPTLDLAKIEAFQERADAQALGQQHTLGPPKSFASSASFMTSPTSSSSSPKQSPYLDQNSSSFGPSLDKEGSDDEQSSNRSSSPFSPVGFGTLPTASPTTGTLLSSDVWKVRESARPRSSSAYAAPTSSLSDAFRSTSRPVDQPGYGANLHSYRSQYGRLHSPNALPQHPQMLSHPLHQRVLAAAGSNSGGRFGTRSGSDPGFRSSSISTVGSTTGQSPSVGRNDQGSGEYSLSIDKVVAGDDKRTTLMIRNIPNKYTQQMLLAEINRNHHGKYDFFYLPIDFKNKCNMGYAFINFIEAESIVPFYQEFDGQKWTNFNSEKVCAISYARLQGKQAMITRFQNSSLLDKHESYRPLVFCSAGPNRGNPEPFPSPKPHLKKSVGLHPHHLHPLMLSADDYALSQVTRLYHQHHGQQVHSAHLLHSQALLANAHAAAAAAMMHGIPTFGLHGSTSGGSHHHSGYRSHTLNPNGYIQHTDRFNSGVRSGHNSGVAPRMSNSSYGYSYAA